MKGNPSRRRAWGLVVAALLGLPVLAFVLTEPGPVTPAPAPVKPNLPREMTVADVTPGRLAIQRSALDGLSTAANRAVRNGVTGVVRTSDAGTALTLAPRSEPYGVADLVAFPEAVQLTPDKRLIIQIPLVVSEGASLTFDSSHVEQILLLSSATRFASLVGFGGTIQMVGSPSVPLGLTTLDPLTGTSDGTIEDGRSFVLIKHGRMDLTYVNVSNLGFGSGIASGIAWAGTELGPARGNVSNSTFRANHFGAYTNQALDMVWSDNVFANNNSYGFDPHDFSNNFVVRGNLAHDNGRHGFIFSRGCDDNLLEHNRSENNLGHGFMIDDGRSGDPGAETGATALPPVESNRNTIRNNVAANNGHSGVEIEGGERNVVRDNLLVDNHIGVRFRVQASGTIESNDIQRNDLSGIDVESDAGDVLVQHNIVAGSWAELITERPVRLIDNRLEVEQPSEVDDGRRQLSSSSPRRAAAFITSHPGIVVWLVAFMVPFIAWGIGRLRIPRGSRRRPSKGEREISDDSLETGRPGADVRATSLERGTVGRG